MGLDKSMADKANMVAIQHADGTCAGDVHLAKKSTKVSKGRGVQEGDMIGYTGMSGCMDEPHLHFNIFKIDDGKTISIPFEFKNNGNTMSYG
jgi:murein DD-endopeptidase MepM/ murein hydrolase activator NlpD